MKDPPHKNASSVDAGSDAPKLATCPACGAILDLRGRQARKGSDDKTWYYRHPRGAGRGCP